MFVTALFGAIACHQTGIPTIMFSFFYTVFVAIFLFFFGLVQYGVARRFGDVTVYRQVCGDRYMTDREKTPIAGDISFVHGKKIAVSLQHCLAEYTISFPGIALVIPKHAPLLWWERLVRQ